MSYTKQENNEFLDKFMEVWRDNSAQSEADVDSIKQTMRACALITKSAQDDFGPTIKLAKCQMMDAEHDIYDLTEPIRTVEKVACLLLLDYEQRKAKAEKAVASLVRIPDDVPDDDEYLAVRGLETKPKLKRKTKAKGGK
jgi:hypothetical protein